MKYIIIIIVIINNNEWNFLLSFIKTFTKFRNKIKNNY